MFASPGARRNYDREMCRNITELRGLEPPATRQEIEAAAEQFVRKVTGMTRPKADVAEAMKAAAFEIADITERLLTEVVPPRRQPPKSVPPLRRPEVRKRLGLEPRRQLSSRASAACASAARWPSTAPSPAFIVLTDTWVAPAARQRSM